MGHSCEDICLGVCVDSKACAIHAAYGLSKAAARAEVCARTILVDAKMTGRKISDDQV